MRFRALSIVFLVSVSAGLLCQVSQASQAPTLRVRWDRDTDFSKYQTFAWKDGTAAVDPTIDALIVQTVGDELAIRGIFPDEDEPDLHVLYHASVRESFEVGGGYRTDWESEGAVTVNSYRAGTLVIDFVDAEKNRIVWRATATAVIQGNPKKNAPLVRQVIQKMFADFHPER